MSRPRMLDLFCGGGGAAAGYDAAGFDVTGVDIQKQGNYPFTFWQADAMQVLRTIAVDGSPFDVIHASPPCQAYTRKAADWGRKRNHWIEHPDLVGPTRELLDRIGLPYVLENVPGAPLNAQLMLCGTMFGLAIRKHRLFESNVSLPLAPRPCSDHSECYNPWQGKGRSADKLRAAMGIDWLPISGGASRKAGYTGDLFNAIPPAFTTWVGQHLMRVVRPDDVYPPVDSWLGRTLDTSVSPDLGTGYRRRTDDPAGTASSARSGPSMSAGSGACSPLLSRGRDVAD